MAWVDVDTDHFSWAPVANGAHSQTFQIRQFTYDAYWKGPGAPIWFYAGNEASVEGYVNATGLMWENALEAGAMLVFAEHRFYGESSPCGGEDEAYADCLHLLTHEQAMADYVQLLAALKQSVGADGSSPSSWSPVIAFGGSYGGMLAAWLRMKYPAAIAGAVAASAPILGFPGLPFYDTPLVAPTSHVTNTAVASPQHQEKKAGAVEVAAAAEDVPSTLSSSTTENGASYWDIVAYDTTSAAGSAPTCSATLKRAFQVVASKSVTAQGRTELEAAFQLCPGTLASDDDSDGYLLQMRVLFAFDDYAMGNYPFPSTYISGGAPLPAFPARVACSLLTINDGSADDDSALMVATGAAVNLLYNATESPSSSGGCFGDLPSRDDELDGIWDVQWCSQLMCQETYFSRRQQSGDGDDDGDDDFAIFPPYAFNFTWVKEHCSTTMPWPTLVPKPHWIANSYYGGGESSIGSDASLRSLLRASGASNIVFSNGEYDPWRAAGVNFNQTKNQNGINATGGLGLLDSIVGVFVQEGAHHLDLMFSTPDDSQQLQEVRSLEMALVKQWADDAVEAREKERHM